MADEIKQVLGFDVSQSLDALNQLDSAFAKMQQNLQGSSNSFSLFNQNAGKTVSALVQIAQRANAAADALGRLNNIPAPSSVPGGGLPSLPGGGGSNLLTGQAAGNALNSLLGQTTNQANAAAAAVTNVGNQGAAALNAAGRSAGGFALSLETITRVIGTQLIVRALNAVRSAVEDSFQGFINFNRAVAEIQTISSTPVDELAKGVRQLSDEFNAPILDVAKAKYQALSAGFVTEADNTKILTAALKLSKVGISDTAEAVNLLTGALNAYGKSADEAETVSARFVKTIQVGRVVASDLANAFGRVAPIGKEVGATEEELLAAFSSITIGGVKASEAATQIRSTLSALLKPSKDAQEALRLLGFETGEQLVAAKGYQGALQALIGTTDGSATSIAKLFPNIRALNGVLRETTTGASIFEDHLKQIQQTSRDLLNQKFEIRVSSDAEKVANDINKIKNFFTVDLGSQLVKTASTTLGLVGGVDTLISALKNLAPVVGIAITALISYGVVVGTITGVHRALTVSFAQAGAAAKVFAGALAGITAAFAAISLGNFIGDKITESINAARKQAQDEAAQQLEFQRGQDEARSTLDKIEADKKFQVLHSVVAESRKAFFQTVDDAKVADKQLRDNDKAVLDAIINAREKFASDLVHVAQKAEQDIVDSKKRANDLAAQLDDDRFRFQNKRFDEAAQGFRDRQRAQDLAAKASSDLSKANTPEQQANAQAEFARAEAFAKEAQSSSETTKNRTAQFQAEQLIEDILQKRIDAEAQFQKTREATARQAAADAAEENERITDLKALTKNFLAKSNLFDTKGELLPSDKVKKNLAQAQDDLEKFKEKAFGPGSKFKLDDLFSFDKLQQRLNSAVSPNQIKELFASGDALDKLREQVQGSLNSAPFQLAVKLGIDESKLKDLSTAEQFSEIDKQLTLQADKLEELRQSANRRHDAERQIKADLDLQTAAYNEQKGIVEKIATTLQTALRIPGATELISAGTQGPAVDLKRARTQIEQISQDPSIDANKAKIAVQDMAKSLDELEKTSPNFLKNDIARAHEEFELMVQILNKRSEINSLNAKGQTDPALQQANELLNAENKKVEAEKKASDAAKQNQNATQALENAAKAAASSFDQSASTTATMAANLAAAADSAERAAAASAAASSGGGGETATASLGRMMKFFSSGGAAKGTDTISAKLSPNETVINAKSSVKFQPQLQAIQAGIPPSTNQSNFGNTIINGDINVNEAGSAKQSAREVTNAIRRLQRRNTVRPLG